VAMIRYISHVLLILLSDSCKLGTLDIAMSTSTPLKREASGPASSGIDGGEEPEQPMANNDGGFEMVLSREEKRKQRKVDKQRPQFQFDTSYFRGGKKIGIAVSWHSLGLDVQADEVSSIYGI